MFRFLVLALLLLQDLLDPLRLQAKMTVTPLPQNLIKWSSITNAASNAIWCEVSVPLKSNAALNKQSLESNGEKCDV